MRRNCSRQEQHCRRARGWDRLAEWRLPPPTPLLLLAEVLIVLIVEQWWYRSPLLPIAEARASRAHTRKTRPRGQDAAEKKTAGSRTMGKEGGTEMER